MADWTLDNGFVSFEDSAITGPNFNVVIDTEYGADQGSERDFKAFPTVTVDAIPAGQTHLIIQTADMNENLLTYRRLPVSSFEEGDTVRGREIKPQPASDVQRKVRCVWRGPAGFSEGPWQVVTQPGSSNIPDPGDPLEFITEPYLIVGPSGAQVGKTINGFEGTFNGALAGTAVRQLVYTNTGETSDTALPVPGFSTTGWNSTLLPVDVLGKYLWIDSTIEDENGNFLTHRSLNPVGPVTAAPTVDLTIDATDITLETVRSLGNGLYQPIFKIPLGFFNPAAYEGWDDPDGPKIQLMWTKATDPQVRIDNAMYLVPSTNTELGQSVPPAPYNAPGYWVPATTPAQKTQTSGTTWADSEYLKTGRQQDESNPRRTITFRRTLDGVEWGPITDFIITPNIPNIPPPPTTGDGWRSIEMTADMFAVKQYGWGHQFMRSMMACEDEPEYIFGMGDMNGARFSETTGRSWFHKNIKGLRTPGGNSVAVDPRDHRRIACVGTMAWWGGLSANYKAQAGAWVSEDWGDNWTLAQQMDVSSADEWNQKLICYDPNTRNSAVNSRRWFLMQRIRPQGSDASGAQLWKSEDGLRSWSKVGPVISESTMGELYYLIALNDNTLAISTQKGVFGSNTAKTAWFRIATGLPTSRCRTLYARADGSEWYAMILGQGLWRRTTGAWTRVQTDAAMGAISGGACKRVGVDFQKSPEILYAFFDQNSGADCTVSKAGNGNGPFVRPPTATAMPGFENDAYHRRLSWSGKYDGYVIPKANTIVVNSVGRIFRSDNGGSNFEDSSHGFTGLNGQRGGTATYTAHPTIANKYAMFAQDVNLCVTVDGMKTWTQHQIPGTVHSLVAAPRPQSSYVGAYTKTGRLLIGVGNASSQSLVYTDNDGALFKAITSANVPRGSIPFIACHPTSNPQRIAAQSRISTDNGATWPTGINGKVIGMSKSGVLYVLRGNNDVWKSADWVNFTPFYQATEKFEKIAIVGQPMWRVSQTAENECWSMNGDKTPIRIRNTGTTFAAAQVLAFPVRQLVSNLIGSMYNLADIEPDSVDNRYVYVSVFGTGLTENIFRGKIAGTSLEWTPISENCPRWQDLGLYSKRSGEIIIAGGVGPWLHKPPVDHLGATEAVVWGNLPQPVKPYVAA